MPGSAIKLLHQSVSCERRNENHVRESRADLVIKGYGACDAHECHDPRAPRSLTDEFCVHLTLTTDESVTSKDAGTRLGIEPSVQEESQAN